MTEILIHRAPVPADRFMIVTNEFMRGELPVPLKVMPRALLGYFLSLPTGWRVTRERIDASVVEGAKAVDAGLRELEETGYLKRARRRGEGGTWAWTYAITDDPKARPLEPSACSPSPGNRQMEPTSENKANPQVAPSTGSREMVSRQIRTEVRDQKTEEKNGAGAPVLDLDLPEPERPEERPAKEPTLNQVANALATEHYEAVSKMGNFMAFREVMAAALKAGYRPAAIAAAAAALRVRNMPLAKQPLRIELEGGIRPANATSRPIVRTGPGGRSGPVLEGYEG